MRALTSFTSLGLLFAAALGAGSAAAETLNFTGSNIGPIPDNSPAGRTVTFNVSGVTRPLRGLSLDLGLVHTWVGDLKLTLRSPLGARRLVVFSRTGVRRGSTFGSNQDLNGVYRFSDLGQANWWALAAAGPNIPPGNYRTSTGGEPFSLQGGCSTHMNVAFGDMSAAEANGQWSLLLVDASAPDAGSINSAVLQIETVDELVFRSGFEPGEISSPPVVNLGPPTCRRTYGDFTGNGLADFAMLRAEGNSVRWLIRPNLGVGEGSEYSFIFGTTNDFALDLDFDGDGIADPAQWTPGPQGVFRVLPSTRASLTPLEFSLGQTNNDPVQSGDYDGDGRDDFAVMQAPATGAPVGPINLVIRSSASGQVRSIQVGTGTQLSHFVLAGYDYTGDGIADAAAQRTDPVTPSQARFEVFSGADGSFLQAFNQGTPTDVLLPGNMVGSPIPDLTTRRTVTGVRQHTTRDMATGVTGAAVPFGASSDTSVVGDFDGDGYEDLGAWRPSGTPGQSKFIIQSSLSPSSPAREVLMGQSGDAPVSSQRTK